MDRQKAWSDKTFDHGKFTYHRSLPLSYHLQKESKELTETLHNYLKDPDENSLKEVTEQLADCFLLLLDCTAHVGYRVDSLLQFAEAKFSVNLTREWGLPDQNGVVEHIKS